MFKKLFKSKGTNQDTISKELLKAEIYLRYINEYKPPATTKREVEVLNQFNTYLFDANLVSPMKDIHY